jgi:ankyrin repeat protein
VAGRSTESLDRMKIRADWFEAERLHRAAAEGDVAGARSLIEGGADLNTFDDVGFTPLHYAVRNGHHGLAKLLLDAGANVNAREESTNSNTAISVAVTEASPEMVELLLQRGANPGIRGWMGIDAYHAAGERTDEEAPRIREILASHRERPHAV